LSSLADAIAGLSLEQRALLELRLQRKRSAAGAAAGAAIARRAAPGPAPLSFAQERLWFLAQLEPGSPLYNVSAAVRLRGRLDAAVLERSLAEVVRRHEILRTTFQVEKGEPVQVAAPAVRLAMPVHDLSALPAAERQARALRLATEEARQPFDLARGPLLRTLLLRLGGAEHLLVVSLHHAVADGGSMEVLVREVGRLAESFAAGRPSPLPELPIQYGDYAAWQRQAAWQSALGPQLAYWTEQLAGAPPLLELPGDRPRPRRSSFRGGRRSRSLRPALAAQLQALARRADATLFMTLLAAFQVLLFRTSDQVDLAVGTPVDNRGRVEVEGLIGFFVNTLVLRTRMRPEQPFPALLAAVRATVLAAHAHQDLPLEKLVETLRPERRASHQPLFQVAFELQAALAGEALPGLRMDLVELDTGTAKFDLTLFVRQGDRGGLTATLEYSSDLFEPATAQRLLGHLESLLAGIVAAGSDTAAGSDVAPGSDIAGPAGAGRAVAELPLLDAAERAQLLVEWADTGREIPRQAAVDQLFAAQAGRRPQAVAVEYDGERLSYRQLDRAANRLAHHLLARGAGPGTRVGLCLERCPAMIVAMLAILKAGAAYVPLDPVHPPRRLAWILADSRAPVLITRRELAARLDLAGVAVVCLDSGAEGAAIARRRAAAPPRRPAAGELAYVIYTSGSTGTPKGVGVPHLAISRLVCNADYVQIQEDDRVAQAANASFDAATFEIWAPLLHGARVVGMAKEVALAPRQFAAQLAARGVTALFLTTALFNQVAREVPAAFAGLRTVLFGGEAVDPAAVRLVLAAGPPQRLLHVYGPTESTTFATWHTVRQVAEGARTIPIGRPIANTRIHLVDAEGQPRPIGVPGEIWIGGDGLARGYEGRPEATAEKFVPGALGGPPGSRLYRTGDLARLLADGSVEFLGRLDHQVKVRGFRVELGEIEAGLTAHPSIREAVVVAGDAPGDRRLAAYVVPVTGAAGADPAAGFDVSSLRAFLRETLPEHMVPAVIVALPALPLNANGKVDRAALPEAVATRAAGCKPFVPPRTPCEEIVAGLFAELLGVAAGADDDFFELGGHSLLATRLATRIRRDLGVELPLRTFFETPSVRAVAAAVEAALRSGGGGGEAAAAAHPPVPAIVPLAEASRRQPQPLSFAQQRLWYLVRFDRATLLYNVEALVRLRGRLDTAALRRAFAAVVRRHGVLRTRFVDAAGAPAQVVGAPWAPPLPVADLSALPAVPRQAELARQAAAEVVRLFDLERGPLLRCRLFRLAAGENALVFTLHHVVADGWSVGVLLREVSTLYQAFTQGLPSPLPELPIQYVDFAVWQRRWLAGEALRAPLAYWREQLRDLAVPDLPTDRPRPALPSERGASIDFLVPAPLADRLRELSGRERCTPFMTVLAAFQTLIHRWCGHDDVSLGTTVAGRDRLEVEDLIGFFVNTLVVRTSLAGDPSFRDLLARVRGAALGAYAHQELPFDKLVEELRPAREAGLGSTPLFRLFFSLHEVPAPAAVPGLSLAIERIDRGISFLDLSLMLNRTAAGLHGYLEYSRDLFDGATARRLAGYLRALLEAIVEAPGERLSRLPLLGAAERHLLLVENQGRQRAFATLPSIARGFERQAAGRPAAVAVVCGDRALTYGELNRRANRLAHHLRQLGVGPEVPVAVLLERSLDLVVALLAILKAGGAYLPMDPLHPAARLAEILESGRAPVLLTEEGLLGRLPRHGARVLCLNGGREPFAAAPDHDMEDGATAANAAYVIFTSGSTGRPKGVIMSHAGVLRLLAATAPWYGFDERDTWSLFFSCAFDFSAWEIWGALLHGGRLVVVPYWVSRSPAELLELLRDERVTVLNQTPAAFLQLAAAEASAAASGLALRVVIFGGEPLDYASLAPWVARHGDAAPRLVNMYGITETAVHTTYRPVEAAAVRRQSPSAIGGPLPDLQVHVLDRRMAPVPLGALGEIHVGGDGLARGYLDRPDLTAERFVPDPFAARPGARLYKSGDLARPAAGGDTVFVGRGDRQVKVRGFRVELGEIEARLAEHPGVGAAAVLLHEDSPGEARLVACVAPHHERAAVVRRWLRLEKEGRTAGLRRYEMPNGMAIFYLENEEEKAFMYRDLFEDQVYFRHGIELADGDRVFDAGANIGLFALAVARRFPRAEIYAFEPVPPVFECLRLNAEVHGLDARLFCHGLADRVGTATLNYYPRFSALSGLYPDALADREIIRQVMAQQGGGPADEGLLGEMLAERLVGESHPCELRTLSHVLRQTGVDRIDLLKVDVEKSELDLLAGIEAADWPKIRQLVVEVYDRDGRLQQVCELLGGQGFEVAVETVAGLSHGRYAHVYARRPGAPAAAVAAVAAGAGTGTAESAAGASAAGAAGVVREPEWSSPDRLVGDLRERLGHQLPAYMVPASFVLVGELPLTANGKVDRRALAALAVDTPRTAGAAVPPRTPVEESVAAIWRESLGVEQVGVRDNFFELGGHSLVLAQVAARLRGAFGVDMPLRTLFNTPTIEGTVAAIAARHLASAPPAVAARILAEVRRLSPQEARAGLEELA
jgi:amino acid adenylation domain-containing protein/FkbM family methyltransferase